MSSWMKQSIGLSTFAFINLVLFITLSTPFNLLMDTIEEESTNPATNVSAQVNPIINNFRTVFGLMFLFSMIGLIVWFFLGTHSSEYESY